MKTVKMMMMLFVASAMMAFSACNKDNNGTPTSLAGTTWKAKIDAANVILEFSSATKGSMTDVRNTKYPLTYNYTAPNGYFLTFNGETVPDGHATFTVEDQTLTLIYGQMMVFSREK